MECGELDLDLDLLFSLFFPFSFISSFSSIFGFFSFSFNISYLSYFSPPKTMPKKLVLAVPLFGAPTPFKLPPFSFSSNYFCSSSYALYAVVMNLSELSAPQPLPSLSNTFLSILSKAADVWISRTSFCFRMLEIYLDYF